MIFLFKTTFLFFCFLFLSHFSYASQFKIPLFASHIELDPALAKNTNDLWISNQIVETLFQREEGGRISSRLLNSWNVSKDRLVYSFTLKKDIFFSSGKELTTDDVFRSLEFTLRSVPQYRYFFQQVQGMHDFINTSKKHLSGFVKKDDLRFEVHFLHPQSDFLVILAAPFFSIADREHEKVFRTGAYKVEIQSKEKIILNKNPYYIMNEKNVENIVFEFLPQGISYKEVSKRKYDILVSIPAYSHFEDKNYSVYWYQHPMVEFMGFNTFNPLWKDKEKRLGFFQQFQKEKWFQKLFKFKTKSWSMANSLLPYNSQLNSSHQIFDDGDKNNFSLKRTVQLGLISHFDLSEAAIEKALKESTLGNPSFHVRHILPESFLEELKKGQIDLYISRLESESGDPYEILSYFSPKNKDGYLGGTHLHLATLFKKLKMQNKKSEKLKIYNEIDTFLQNEGFVFPLARTLNEKMFVTSRCKLKNYTGVAPWFYKLSNLRCN